GPGLRDREPLVLLRRAARARDLDPGGAAVGGARRRREARPGRRVANGRRAALGADAGQVRAGHLAGGRVGAAVGDVSVGGVSNRQRRMTMNRYQLTLSVLL